MRHIGKRYKRIFTRIAIISLLLLALSSLGINLIVSNDYFTGVGELLYSTCYILVYISIFTLLVSTIVLLVLFFAKSKVVSQKR
jgi:hypothetical protein